jgi:hypothetical protein
MRQSTKRSWLIISLQLGGGMGIYLPEQLVNSQHDALIAILGVPGSMIGTCLIMSFIRLRPCIKQGSWQEIWLTGSCWGGAFISMALPRGLVNSQHDALIAILSLLGGVIFICLTIIANRQIWPTTRGDKDDENGGDEDKGDENE